ncbi:MAG: hypothetical protein ACJZ64_08400 [Opitutales bacterium]
MSSRGRKPVAIHGERGSELIYPYAYLACSGLPRRTLILLAWTRVYCHRDHRKPVAIHCVSESEPHLLRIPPSKER